MSISCYCARNAFGKHSLKMTKVETFKAVVELRCYRNVSRNNLVIINSVARSLSGTGPKTPSSDMSKNDGEKSKESTSEIKQDKYLENFKPLSEQTDKILKVIQTASKQITENATKYYHEKRNYLAKGKLLSPEGEEEHWYAARVNFLMKRYENFVGLTDVKNAQVRVQKTEKLFVKSQDDRRETQRLINEVQAKIKNLHTELERTHRGEDKYLELVTLEHQVLREERILIEQLSQLERDEREAFSRLSRAVRDSHESERAQAEKTKYWAVLGSIIGTTLGVLGTTINNRLRMRELRQIVRDAATGHSQIGVAAAATGAAGSVVTLDHAQLNNNLASLTSGLAVVKDNISEFSENLQRVGNATTEKINEVSNSISTLSKDFNQQQSKSLEVMSLIDNHTKLNLKNEMLPETINNKSLLELQKSIETQIMRWEEKMDNIMKLHFENSSDSKALSKLEKKVTEVLTFEKETTKLNARLHEEINRSGAIAFEAFQKRVGDIEEKLKDVRSLLLTQSAMTEHQTKVMINSAASTAAAKTASSSNLSQNVTTKENVKMQKERTREALEALERSEMVIVNTMEWSLKEHEERLNKALIINTAFVAVLTPLLVYAINKML